jgi:4-hydroxy 2-oxovalerate aldolase
MYRPKIKVVDVTLRDGGLVNNWNFSDEFARNVISFLAQGGVDYIELGYRASTKQFSRKDFGKWRFCIEDEIKPLLEGIPYLPKLAAMVDIDRTELEAIPPQKDSIFSLIRVATYCQDVDKAMSYVKYLHDQGYETTVNIMAISHVLNKDLEEALTQLSGCETGVVYVVDSFGSLYSEQIEGLVEKFRTFLPGKEIGIHTHNNQQLAYANTIQAIIKNANYLDASVNGIGRGPGNCCLELLFGFLKNPKYQLAPVLELIEKEFVPLREKIEWGYMIPYMITGLLDEHPRSAIALRSGPDKDRYKDFYLKLTESTT